MKYWIDMTCRRQLINRYPKELPNFLISMILIVSTVIKTCSNFHSLFITCYKFFVYKQDKISQKISSVPPFLSSLSLYGIIANKRILLSHHTFSRTIFMVYWCLVITLGFLTLPSYSKQSFPFHQRNAQFWFLVQWLPTHDHDICMMRWYVRDYFKMLIFRLNLFLS